MNTAAIEEFEFLLHRLTVLHEVEDLAIQGKPEMLPELRRLYRSTFKQLRAQIRRLLKVRPALGGRGPGASLEILERIFLRLRDQAEVEGSRAAKYRGVKGKRPRVEAKEIKKMARSAARALKAAATHLGRWDETYAAEYGLDNWL